MIRIIKRIKIIFFYYVIGKDNILDSLWTMGKESVIHYHKFLLDLTKKIIEETTSMSTFRFSRLERVNTKL